MSFQLSLSPSRPPTRSPLPQMVLIKAINAPRARPPRRALLFFCAVATLSFFWYARKSSIHPWSVFTNLDLPEFCYDPYRLPGHAAPPQSPKTRSPNEAVWVIPHPSSTQTQSGKIQEDFYVDSLFAELVSGAEPAWLRNRTVIFIGDSLDRNLVHFFAHEAFPPPSLHRFLNSQTDPAFISPTPEHRIGVGYHRNLGFTIANWFLMGVGVEKPAKYFHFNEDEPQKMEDRIPHFFLPLLGPILSPDPDMIIFNAGLWDLVYRSETAGEAGRQKIAPERPTGGPLTEKEIQDHEKRVIALINLLHKAFPNPKTRLVYRTMPDSSRTADDNAMSRQRVRRLDDAHVRLIGRLNAVPGARPIDIIDWSRLTRGLLHELEDLVHFRSGHAQWFYAELVLNHLRRLVLGDGPETKWADCYAYLRSRPASSTLGLSRSTFRSPRSPKNWKRMFKSVENVYFQL